MLMPGFKIHVHPIEAGMAYLVAVYTMENQSMIIRKLSRDVLIPQKRLVL